jgi:hypothetical protein
MIIFAIISIVGAVSAEAIQVAQPLGVLAASTPPGRGLLVRKGARREFTAMDSAELWGAYITAHCLQKELS